jgi:hypothetical protein
MKLIILLSIEEMKPNWLESPCCIKEYGQDEVFNTIDNLLNFKVDLTDLTSMDKKELIKF